jgi:hypothetical protein
MESIPRRLSLTALVRGMLPLLSPLLGFDAPNMRVLLDGRKVQEGFPLGAVEFDGPDQEHHLYFLY